MTSTDFAPAKVNLYLHVGALQPDGYHPLESLMVFGDVGDRLSLTPADDTTLEVTGEFGGFLASATADDNLVLRAARTLLARTRAPGARLTLEKNLPIAAGLGGGSSDAGAALRLVRDGLSLEVDDAELAQIASGLGADGAACFAARPVLASGRGERIVPVDGLPTLDAVLINPRTPCATGAVYRVYDAARSASKLERPPTLPTFADAPALIDYLQTCRNDLERPAAAIAPAIDEVLAAARAQPETRLARLSGSGATVFAVCDDAASVLRLCDSIGRTHPDWWRAACRLGGPWSLADAARSTPTPRRLQS